MTTSLGSEAAWQAYLSEDYSWFPLRSGILAIVLATIAYPLRFWARRLQTAPWGWSDWLMIPSYVFVVGTGVCGIFCSIYGAGRHIEQVMIESPWHFDYWGALTLYITPIFYIPGVTFPKLSIFCLYLRIFNNRFMRACCWLMMGMLVVRLIVEFITIPLQCNHLWYAWQPSLWAGNCDQIWVHYTWGRLPNVISDVVMLILPLPTLWRLQLEFRVKLGLLGTFCLGGFGLATAILNTVAFVEQDVFNDITWASGALVAWSVLETSVYFNTACLLTYRPLLTHFLRSTAVRSALSRGNSRNSRSKRDGGRSGLEKPALLSPNLSDKPMSTMLEQSQSSPSSSEPPRRPLYISRSASYEPPQRPVNMKTLPATPSRLSLSEIEYSPIPMPLPTHQAKRDGCGSCYDCVAVEISQHMERAHTVDIV